MSRSASFFQQPWQWWGATGWLTAVCVGAVLAPSGLVAPNLSAISQPPFRAVHWLGTTAQGTDVGLSLLQGARTILLISVPAALLTLLLGALLGSIAGFFQDTRWRISGRQLLAAGLPLLVGVATGPRWFSAQLVLLPLLAAFGWLIAGRLPRRSIPVPVDTLVMGAVSLLESLPLLLLVLLAAAVQRPSLSGLLLLLSLTCWTIPARLMRAATLQINAQPYIEAAEAAGLPAARILLRHIWPNTWHILRTRFPLTVAALIGFETTLSFLGVGLPPEVPSWGRLLAGIRHSPADWWLLAGPGLALVITVVSLQVLAQRESFGR